MARQKGIHLFTGKISTTSGYKRAHDNTNSSFERSKGGPSIKQMDELPSMKRNREIMQEFSPVNDYAIRCSNIMNEFFNLKGIRCRSQLHKCFQSIMLMGDGDQGVRNFAPTQHLEIYPRLNVGDFKIEYAQPYTFIFNDPANFPDLTVASYGTIYSNQILKPANATDFRYKVLALQIIDKGYNAITKRYYPADGIKDLMSAKYTSPWMSFATPSHSPFLGNLTFPFQMSQPYTLTMFWVAIEFGINVNSNYSVLQNKSYISCVKAIIDCWL